MSKLRKLFAVLALILLTSAVVIQSWGLEFAPARTTVLDGTDSADPGVADRKNKAKTAIELMQRYQRVVVEWQLKLALGVLGSAEDAQSDRRTVGPMLRTIADSIADSVQEFEILAQRAGPASNKDQLQYLSFARLVAAELLETPELLEAACDKRKTADFENSAAQISSSNFGAQYCDTPSVVEPLGEEQKRSLIKRFGWIAELQTSLGDPLRMEPLYANARSSFIPIAVLTIILLPVMLLGSSYFIFRWLKGSFHYVYPEEVLGRLGADKSWLLLEAFLLYLGGMLLSVQAGSYVVNSELQRLPFATLYICLLTLTLLWPRLCGMSAAQLRIALGVYTSGLRRFVADFFTGPLVYLSVIPLFLLALGVYGAVLSGLGIDPSSGAHPAITALANSNSPSLAFWLAMLAVVVAPITEELFFRGALFSWLRERLSARWTILASSVLFAMLHPQGAVGVVPLTLIAITLAWLREWRGGILPCITFHMCVNGMTFLLARQLL